jgi:hypothetical protein
MGPVGAPTRRTRQVCPIPLTRNPCVILSPTRTPLVRDDGFRAFRRNPRASGVKTLASCMRRGVWGAAGVPHYCYVAAD